MDRAFVLEYLCNTLKKFYAIKNSHKYSYSLYIPCLRCMSVSLLQGQTPVLYTVALKSIRILQLGPLGKCFTYVNKTCANLTTYSKKPENYNGTIIFEIDIMKKSSPINLNPCQT